MRTDRIAPEHILTQLREVDPAADCFWVGTGWMLAVRRPNDSARDLALAAARRIEKAGEASEEDRYRLLYYAWLADEGIRPIRLYEQEECDERIVKDFQERDWNFRHRAEETVAENIELSTDEARYEANQALVREALQSQKRDIYRVFKGNPQVPSAGVPKEED